LPEVLAAPHKGPCDHLEHEPEGTSRTLHGWTRPTCTSWWLRSPATPATHSLETDELTVWQGFLRASTQVIDQLDRELRETHDLSLAEYDALFQLSAAPGRRLRMSALADSVLITRSRLTHTIDRLERRGFVVREQADDDKRGTYAVLTREGHGLVRRAGRTHVDGIRRLFLDPLGPGELAPVGAALSRIAAQSGP